MGKIGIIASTEFAASVRTKAFLVGIFLMPLLMIGSIVIQTVVADRVDTKPRRFAVVDRSGVLYPTIRTVAAAWNDVVEGKSKRDDPRLPSMPGRRRTSAGPASSPRSSSRRAARSTSFDWSSPTASAGANSSPSSRFPRASSTPSGGPTPGFSITPTARTTTP